MTRRIRETLPTGQVTMTPWRRADVKYATNGTKPHRHDDDDDIIRSILPLRVIPWRCAHD
jgi:hypothetical protein